MRSIEEFRSSADAIQPDFNTAAAIMAVIADDLEIGSPVLSWRSGGAASAVSANLGQAARLQGSLIKRYGRAPFRFVYFCPRQDASRARRNWRHWRHIKRLLLRIGGMKGDKIQFIRNWALWVPGARPTRPLSVNLGFTRV